MDDFVLIKAIVICRECGEHFLTEKSFNTTLNDVFNKTFHDLLTKDDLYCENCFMMRHYGTVVPVDK